MWRILVAKLDELQLFKMANFHPRHCTVSTCLLVSILWPFVVWSSPLEVEEGLYSRVTVQIEAQPQPENCVEFLNQLEVGNHKRHFFTKEQRLSKLFNTLVIFFTDFLKKGPFEKYLRSCSISFKLNYNIFNFEWSFSLE